MLGKLAVGEIAVGEVGTGEIVLGKLRWGNDLTPYLKLVTSCIMDQWSISMLPPIVLSNLFCITMFEQS